MQYMGRVRNCWASEEEDFVLASKMFHKHILSPFSCNAQSTPWRTAPTLFMQSRIIPTLAEPQRSILNVLKVHAFTLLLLQRWLHPFPFKGVIRIIENKTRNGRATAQAAFSSRAVHIGFVVDIAALGPITVVARSKA
jgi:hypothetical protein